MVRTYSSTFTGDERSLSFARARHRIRPFVVSTRPALGAWTANDDAVIFLPGQIRPSSVHSAPGRTEKGTWCYHRRLDASFQPVYPRGLHSSASLTSPGIGFYTFPAVLDNRRAKWRRVSTLQFRPEHSTL